MRKQIITLASATGLLFGASACYKTDSTKTAQPGANNSATTTNTTATTSTDTKSASPTHKTVTPSVPTTATIAGQTTPAAPTAPAPECFSISYHHKALASHPNEEACSHHKNLLKLRHTKVNPSSICVRANGTPVRFQMAKGKSDELVIGPVAGPKSTITVRYCINKKKCSEECVIPKDEFMDAIGGSGDTPTAQMGQWDSNDSQLDAAVNKEVAEISKIAQTDGSEGSEIFRDWINDGETTACGVRQAALSGVGVE